MRVGPMHPKVLRAFDQQPRGRWTFPHLPPPRHARSVQVTEGPKRYRSLTQRASRRRRALAAGSRSRTCPAPARSAGPDVTCGGGDFDLGGLSMARFDVRRSMVSLLLVAGVWAITA